MLRKIVNNKIEIPYESIPVSKANPKHDLPITKPLDKSNVINTVTNFPFLQNNKRSE